MSTLSLRLPESLHLRLAEVAAREGVSINQLISSAVAEKMAALLTEEYLAKRAERGGRARFTAALAKVPDVEPEASDRIEARPSRRAPQPPAAAVEPTPRRPRTRARR
jgi:HicB family